MGDLIVICTVYISTTQNYSYSISLEKQTTRKERPEIERISGRVSVQNTF